MKKFLKYLLKWSIRIIILTIILFSALVYFLHNPSFLFKYEKKYNNMELYSDSVIDDNYLNIIDKAIERISDIEIYNPNYHPNIYFISDIETYELLATLSNENKYTQSMNLTAFGNIFLNLTKINEINLNHDPSFTQTLLEGKIDQILAHEFVHGFITDRLGFFTQINIPLWKKEGYCEYASTISRINGSIKSSIIKRAKSLYNYDISSVSTSSVFYYRAHLIVEYLSELHKMKFDQIMELPAKYEKLVSEFDEWYLLQTGKL